jgi:uncharacterized DUF497 family protein
MVTWDESKRLSNRPRHGLDFAGCKAIFDSPVLTTEDDREAYGEQRITLIGWLAGNFGTDDLHRTRRRRARDLAPQGQPA